MDFIEVVKISLLALRANKIRSSLTMLGIIIGVASVILLVSIGSGLKTYITQQLEGLGANSLFVFPGEFEITPGGGGGGGTPGAGIASSKFTFDHVRDLENEGQTIKSVMPYTENNGTMKYKGKAPSPRLVASPSTTLKSETRMSSRAVSFPNLNIMLPKRWRSLALQLPRIFLVTKVRSVKK